MCFINFLVIGGTYFLGKSFVELAVKDNHIITINRGTRNDRLLIYQTFEENIVEFVSDRHDTKKLTGLCDKEFDIVIDFCAYSKGDIQTIIELFKSKIKQYIFISTSDVYVRGTGEEIDEDTEFETRDFGGEAGEYILGKVALERELVECCNRYNISYTSIRPAFIYGPENYAPREGIFFTWILKAGQIIFPQNANGYFQMVYVKDVANFILKVCGNEKAYNKAYNFCGNEKLDYERFAQVLAQASGVEFERINLTVDDIIGREIPLPFPLTKQESEFYISKNINDFNIEYTPIEVGMQETFRYFMKSGLY